MAPTVGKFGMAWKGRGPRYTGQWNLSPTNLENNGMETRNMGDNGMNDIHYGGIPLLRAPSVRMLFDNVVRKHGKVGGRTETGTGQQETEVKDISHDHTNHRVCDEDERRLSWKPEKAEQKDRQDVMWIPG
jgi:hypothetical protein